jgi:hypothetical protein
MLRRGVFGTTWHKERKVRKTLGRGSIPSFLKEGTKCIPSSSIGIFECRRMGCIAPHDSMEVVVFFYFRPQDVVVNLLKELGRTQCFAPSAPQSMTR